MEIKKKCWSALFQKILDGKKNVDVRLADFDVKEGDVLIFEEYDNENILAERLRRKLRMLIKLILLILIQ